MGQRRSVYYVPSGQRLGAGPFLEVNLRDGQSVGFPFDFLGFLDVLRWRPAPGVVRDV
jgi:hypothetical protein